MRTTKIIATLGPSTDPPGVLRSLLAAGANVFRMNASHGSREEREQRIRAVRALAAEMGVYAGVLLDLQGPKIRLGEFPNGPCVLETGARFTITTEAVAGDCQRASTGYAGFARDVQPGARIPLNDGAVELRALSTDGVTVECEVVSGGPVSSRKGINLPGVAVSSPSLTTKDMDDLRAALGVGIDFVALSFVREREDLLRLRHFLESAGAALPVIAKVEKPEAWQHIDEILEACDGVMVARGDLGVEIALERVPAIQKSIVRRARARGRFTIIATQMLESMIESAVPTRAEVSDVANAIYDGTDAVMLSAETSAGKHPVESVQWMAKIAGEAESSIRRQGFKEPPAKAEPTHAEIVGEAAYRAARSASVRALGVFTATGSSAALIARYRPPVPIYAFTPSEATARKLSILYGAQAVLAPPHKSTDEMLAFMDRTMIDRGWLKPGDSVVFVAGQPIGRPGTTNLIKLHRLGQTE